MKLTRAQIKKMQEIEQLLAVDRRLTTEERQFVLEHYQEGANNNNAAVGAFFTPQRLARDFAYEVPDRCDTLVDLCAGIGSLAFACEEKASRIICVEQCAEYVRVGRKIMPEATWIHADVFGDWWKDFDSFDAVISNPPFGSRVSSSGFEGLYTGKTFEYRVIELASRIADHGTFIVPQPSAPFRYSGARCYQETITADCGKFMEQTGIVMEMNCGIDTTATRDEWHGVAPLCEIVVCPFDEMELMGAAVQARAEMVAVPLAQMDLFAAAA